MCRLYKGGGGGDSLWTLAHDGGTGYKLYFYSGTWEAGLMVPMACRIGDV